MKTFLDEAAEFTGRACGAIARDVSEFSRPLGAAFLRGWQSAWKEARESDSANTETATETV